MTGISQQQNNVHKIDVDSRELRLFKSLDIRNTGKVVVGDLLDTLKKSGVARFSFVEAEDGLNALNKLRNFEQKKLRRPYATT